MNHLSVFSLGGWRLCCDKTAVQPVGKYHDDIIPIAGYVTEVIELWWSFSSSLVTCCSAAVRYLVGTYAVDWSTADKAECKVTDWVPIRPRPEECSDLHQKAVEYLARVVLLGAVHVAGR